MKKILVATCTLLTITASACLAQDIVISDNLIAAAGYQPSGGYKGAAGYKSTAGYQAGQGYKSTAGYKAGQGYKPSGGYKKLEASDAESNNGAAQDILRQATQQSGSQGTAKQAQQLQQWLDSNPAAAKELEQITKTGSDPSQQILLLQQWLQNHPESTQQLQQMLLITPQ